MKKNPYIKYLIPALIVVPVLIYNSLLGYILFGVSVLYVLFMERSILFLILTNQKYRRGDLENSLKWLKRAYSSGKSRPDISILYGYLSIKMGNIEESEKVFQKLLDSDIDNQSRAKARLNYALVIWKKGELNEAIKILEEVFMDYKDRAIYGSLGYLLILSGDFKKALEFNQVAYQYNASDAVILDNLGYSYYKTGNMKKAKEIYEQLMGLTPPFPEAYYNFSCIKKDEGDLKGALDLACKAKEFKPSFLSNFTDKDLRIHIDELKSLMSANS
ncbi:MAG: tetratricopeptide repeat protein [Clostridium sp.]|nr:tetratricopeptide repeat protein [Clostridium sp.]